MKIPDLARRTVAAYITDDCGSRSAAIAYFALASLFPGLLLLLTLLSRFVSGTQAQERVVEIVGVYIPVPAITAYVRSNLHTALQWRGTMAFVGLALLLWSTRGVFLAAEWGLSRVWYVERRRASISSHLLSMLAMLIVGSLLAFQFSLNAFLRTVMIWQIPFMGFSYGSLQITSTLLSWIVSPIILFSIFVCLYTLLPRHRLPLRTVWPGSLFAAATYQVVEHLFVYYVTFITHVTVLYGAASGLIVLMLWLYLSANIFYLGAELIYVLAADDGLLPPSPR